MGESSENAAWRAGKQADQRCDDEEEEEIAYFKRRDLRFHAIKPRSVTWNRNICEMLERMGLRDFVVTTAMPALEEDLCVEMIKSFVGKKGLDGGQGKVRGSVILLCPHSIRSVTALPLGLLGDDQSGEPLTPAKLREMGRSGCSVNRANDFMAIARLLEEKFLCRDDHTDDAGKLIHCGMRVSLEDGIVMPWAAAMTRNMTEAILMSKERNLEFPFGQWLSAVIRSQLEEGPRKRKAQTLPVAAKRSSSRKRKAQTPPIAKGSKRKLRFHFSKEPEGTSPPGKGELGSNPDGTPPPPSQVEVNKLGASAPENLEVTPPAMGEIGNKQGTPADKTAENLGDAAHENLGDTAATMEIASSPTREGGTTTVAGDLNVEVETPSARTPMAKEPEVQGEAEAMTVSSIETLLDGFAALENFSASLQPEKVVETGSATDGRVGSLQGCAFNTVAVELTLCEAIAKAAGMNPEGGGDFSKAAGDTDNDAVDSEDASNKKRMEMMMSELSKLRQERLDSMVVERNKLREQVDKAKEKLLTMEKIDRELMETTPSLEQLASKEEELCGLRQQHKETLELRKVLDESRLKPKETVSHLCDQYERYKAMLEMLQVGPD